MPTYTYECQACGHRYDAFQSMKDDPDTICPECQGRVERLIGAGAGIVFKGSGFYVTDYRKDGNSGSKGGAASTTAGASKEGGSGGTDSGTSGAKTSAGGTGDSGGGTPVASN